MTSVSSSSKASHRPGTEQQLGGALVERTFVRVARGHQVDALDRAVDAPVQAGYSAQLPFQASM
jgi:hypothetical protein